MKVLKFGDNAATIGGKRVPYALLGALAAILGAFLIWKFNQAGGLSLGTTPDLSTLLGGGGGSGDSTTGLPSDLSGLTSESTVPNYAPVSVPTYSYNYGPASTPIFDVSAAAAPSTTRTVDQAASYYRNPYPGQLGSVSVFAPVAPSLGNLLPGILTPARAPAPSSPPPPKAVAGSSLISGINSLITAQPTITRSVAISGRSSGAQAIA